MPVRVLVVLLAALLAVPAASAAELVVTLEEPGGRAAAERVAASVGGTVVDAIPELRAYLIEAPGPLAPRLAASAAVRAAEPNAADTLAGSPPYRGADWQLRAASVPDAWAVTRGDPSVVVAVVDTGIDPSRPEFAGRLILGPDTANEDDDPTDVNGHGTSVAALVGADSPYAPGVCPRCTVMAIKAVADRSEEATKFDSAEAIVWAVDHGARIVNLSFSGPERSTVQEDAIRYALARGVLVVGSAGNTDASVEQYPAAYEGVLAVGATDQRDGRWSGSAFGPWVDLGAPGAQIVALALDGAHEIRHGTSFAAPIVAGVAGLLASARPDSSVDSLSWALTAGTVALANGERPFARGRIDAALTLAKASTPGAPTLSVVRLAVSPQAPFVRDFAAARAGERFAVGARVVRDDTGEQVRGGEVACTASVGARPLRVVKAGFAKGAARCVVAVPRWAGDRWILGTLTVRRDGFAATQEFRVKAKKLLPRS